LPANPARTASLTGKRVIVTGAGNGLGRAYASYLGAHGASVVVNDVDPAKAETVAEEIAAAGGKARAIGCSVADWDDAARIVELCIAEFGAVDGLVNNAGVHWMEEPWLEEEAPIRSMISVNLMGAVFVGVHAIRKMVKQGRGSIVNITSTSQLGLSRSGVYAATKGGLASLTYSWAIDLARHGVRVNAYSPQAETAIVASKPFPGDLPTPAENAPLIGYLLSDLSADLTGQVVARRGNRLVVMSHPDLTDFSASAAPETIDALHEQLGPVVRAGLQPIGDPRMGKSRIPNMQQAVQTRRP
jgi:NAD(P)-dependent dehydrogenase (short-subunit alcohol dehydrogenase family)